MYAHFEPEVTGNSVHSFLDLLLIIYQRLYFYNLIIYCSAGTSGVKLTLHGAYWLNFLSLLISTNPL